MSFGSAATSASRTSAAFSHFCFLRNSVASSLSLRTSTEGFLAMGLALSISTDGPLSRLSLRRPGGRGAPDRRRPGGAGRPRERDRERRRPARGRRHRRSRWRRADWAPAAWLLVFVAVLARRGRRRRSGGRDPGRKSPPAFPLPVPSGPAPHAATRR